MAQGISPELDTLVDLLLSKALGGRPPGAKASREIVRNLREAALDQPGAATSGTVHPISRASGFADTVRHLEIVDDRSPTQKAG